MVLIPQFTLEQRKYYCVNCSDSLNQPEKVCIRGGGTCDNLGGWGGGEGENLGIHIHTKGDNYIDT